MDELSRIPERKLVFAIMRTLSLLEHLFFGIGSVHEMFKAVLLNAREAIEKASGDLSKANVHNRGKAEDATLEEKAAMVETSEKMSTSALK